MAFVNYWSPKAEITTRLLVGWIGISAPRFNDWKRRYGKVNEHNNWIPSDYWLEDWEKNAILDFYKLHHDDGYRRLTFMMLDKDVVAVSLASVYRVLLQVGVMRKWVRKAAKKGAGFVWPLKSHEHWHVDVLYIKSAASFITYALFWMDTAEALYIGRFGRV